MHIMKPFSLFRSIITATWPLPSSDGCRPPYTRLIKGFREGVQVWGECEERPMVWETREVREANWVRAHVVYLKLRPHTTQHNASLWLTPFKFKMIIMHQGPVPWVPNILYSPTMPPPPPLSMQPAPLTRIRAIPFVDSHYHNHLPMSRARYDRQMRPLTPETANNYLPPLAATATMWSIHSTMKEIHAH